MSQDVFVVAEHLKGALADVSFELLGKGRELARRLEGNLVAALLGNAAFDLARQMGAADKVFYVEHPALADFNPETHGRVLAELIRAHRPRVVLVPNTSMGMDLAARLSAQLELPLATYAIELLPEDGALIATSQLYGGKIHVESELEGDSVLVSVIAGSFPAGSWSGTKSWKPGLARRRGPGSTISGPRRRGAPAANSGAIATGCRT